MWEEFENEYAAQPHVHPIVCGIVSAFNEEPGSKTKLMVFVDDQK
ncbi:MAG: hypothetical protein ACOCUV_00475 [bacterium]